MRHGLIQCFQPKGRLGRRRQRLPQAERSNDTHATGTAEREVAEALLAVKVKQTGKPATSGADKACDASEHGANVRKLKITPHVARSDALTKTGKRRISIVSDTIAASAGYAMSQTRSRNHKTDAGKRAGGYVSVFQQTVGATWEYFTEVFSGYPFAYPHYSQYSAANVHERGPLYRLNNA